MSKLLLSTMAIGKKLQGENSHVTIGLTNPKSPSNVGAVMRAAGCYCVEQVLYTGQRYANAAKFNGAKHSTDTKNARDKIPLKPTEEFENIESLRTFLPDNTKIICVDLVEGAIPLPHFNHPEKAVYIFGPEDGTISQSMINTADDVVYVPTVGCMNLAASVNVLLYDRLAKALVNNKQIQSDNTLIRKSRDTNNKVKVKRG
ncbi:RNA methyltransferase [Colwellia sp. MSW7]|jgi:tRNA(Leu) C34 or U34 (ribose-2'-O)-methylase TrmL|uniref:RNA methyltransferase n=1 Tax=Colwellia maritima TaxID=2912588 RepID=A0ABS9WZ68_9GAMM|nr:RNA methyltransferase [Colwellia maritima]MCI2283295.1 RNA methyltransferase [Colwellia maritima]